MLSRHSPVHVAGDGRSVVVRWRDVHGGWELKLTLGLIGGIVLLLLLIPALTGGAGEALAGVGCLAAPVFVSLAAVLLLTGDEIEITLSRAGAVRAARNTVGLRSRRELKPPVTVLVMPIWNVGETAGPDAKWNVAFVRPPGIPIDTLMMNADEASALIDAVQSLGASGIVLDTKSLRAVNASTLCSRCGYDLIAAAAPLCPECGEPIAPARLRHLNRLHGEQLAVQRPAGG